MAKEKYKMDEEEVRLLCEAFSGLTPEDLEIAEVVPAEEFIRELEDIIRSIDENGEDEEDEEGEEGIEAET